MREVSRRLLASGNVINLQAIQWQDATGTDRLWEMAERVGKRRAVMLIAWLMPSERLVLVRQYRPPAQGIVVEFPAGIIEEGESPEQAALRELREETGYQGQIDQILPPAFNTPGLSSETAYPVLIEVDESLPENISPVQHPDGDESIEVVLVSRDDLADFVERELAAGSLFDSKVITYVAGLARG